MGEVFRAHDPRTGRDVAIKVSAQRFSERFDREVRAVAALNHPNICTLFDVGPDYLVMEFIEGELLEGPVPLPGCDSRTVDPGRESLVGGLDRLRWRPPHRSTRHQLPLF
jgi:serine/threonine protein kinase